MSILIIDNKKEIMIWLALVEIKAINKNKTLGGSDGAYVNVAYQAESEDDFKNKLTESFLNNDFQVIEIDDIETKNKITIDNPDNAEKMELINDIEAEGYEFSWGVFHTFDEV